jgi:predicted DNA-binding transcriptional regulator YafY
LQAGFVDERVVRAEYVREDGARTERRLEPHALIINSPAWYLMGHDLARGGARTFRLDRFVSVDIEPESFRPRPEEIVQELRRAQGVVLERV